MAHDGSSDEYQWRHLLSSLTCSPLQDEDRIEPDPETADEGDSSDIEDKAVKIARLKQRIPPGCSLSFYLDYDQNHLVVFPVLLAGQKQLSMTEVSMDDDQLAEYDTLHTHLRLLFWQLGLQHASRMPRLLFKKVTYVHEVIAFFTEAMDAMAQLGRVFYTPAFRKIMVRKTIKMRATCSGGQLQSLLRLEFGWSEDITAEELSRMIKDTQDPDAFRFFMLKQRGFIDLHAEPVRQALKLLSDMEVSPSELSRHSKQIRACDIPYALSLIRQAAATAVSADDEKFNQAERQLYAVRPLSDHLPLQLRASLRPYQIEGFHWLSKIFSAQLGGILADDMGLGKTLQTIALIQSMINTYPASRVLIVVPTSLVANWLHEIRSFAPDLHPVAVVGTVPERQTLLGELDPGQASILITTYGLLTNDLDLYREIMFDLLVMDEAQKAKNMVSKTAQTLGLIKARCRFALTGTPVENNLSELWSIFHITLPHLLRSYTSFKSAYMNDQADLVQLRQKIRPFLLRRVKKDVLQDLPAKTESHLFIDLSDEQKKLYVAYRERAISLLQEDQPSMIHVLAQLTRLRQICCHPAMFLKEYSGSASKIEALMDILEDLKAEGRRALVFSQFTALLDLIERQLSRESIRFVRLDGQTPQQQRSDIIREFAAGDQTVFLISLKAGGVGLNLTAADTVIHCDPWWNPSVEEQAAARAHRIGQARAVQIIHLIAQGTIEDAINEIKQKKRDLIDSLIQPEDGQLIRLSVAEIRELLLSDKRESGL